MTITAYAIQKFAEWIEQNFNDESCLYSDCEGRDCFDAEKAVAKYKKHMEEIDDQTLMKGECKVDMKTDNEIVAEYEEKFCNNCANKHYCHIPCVTITRYILEVQKGESK